MESAKSETTEQSEVNTSTSTKPFLEHNHHGTIGKRKLQPEKDNDATVNNNNNAKKYKYGNYDRYYGYRNPSQFNDIRLAAFKQHPNLFQGKDILDIGCNNGLVTIAVARHFHPKSITGIDIDKMLIGRARQHILAAKSQSTTTTSENLEEKFPNNVLFKHGDYVLSDRALLSLEREQFDTILCLSITKWIHLNNGDAGLKLAFQRMYKQLRAGGHLILEAQDWKSYKRRKKLTPEIYQHFKSIKLLPAQFESYLVSDEVGFVKCFNFNLTKHDHKGFQRPIQVFVKPAEPQLPATS